MSFLQKYLISSKLEEAGETMSFRAHDTVTGQQVLLHQLLPGRTPLDEPELSAMILHYFPGGGEPGTEHFREVGQDEERVFVVTADLPECVDIRQWLYTIAAARADKGVLPEPSTTPVVWPQKVASGPAAPPATPAGPEVNATPEVKPPDSSARGHVPAGFEVVYQSRKHTGVHAVPTLPLSSSPDSLAPTRVISAQGPEAAGGDEFDKLFGGVGDKAPAPPAAATTPSAAPSPGQKPAPGKFTQMFSAVSLPDPGKPSPSPSLAGSWRAHLPQPVRKRLRGSLPRCSPA